MEIKLNRLLALMIPVVHSFPYKALGKLYSDNYLLCNSVSYQKSTFGIKKSLFLKNDLTYFSNFVLLYFKYF